MLLSGALPKAAMALLWSGAMSAGAVVIDSPAATSQAVEEFNRTLSPVAARSLAVRPLATEQSAQAAKPPSAAKDRLQGGNTGAAAVERPRRFSNETGCSYLTKPMMRADGGGLNRHAVGSTVCFEEKIQRCTETGWDVIGPCTVAGIPTAQEVEGSRFSNQVNQPQDDDQAGSGGRSGGAVPSLMGQSSTGQRLREDQAGLRQQEQQLQMQQRQLQQQRQEQPDAGGWNGGRASGNGGRNAAAGNAQDCANMRIQLTAMEQQLAEFERFARASTTTGGINPRYAADLERARSERARAQATMRAQGCN